MYSQNGTASQRPSIVAAIQFEYFTVIETMKSKMRARLQFITRVAIIAWQSIIKCHFVKMQSNDFETRFTITWSLTK